MNILGLVAQSLGWFAISVVVMSFVEHYVHRHMMHRKHWLSGLKPVEKIFVNHTFKHHQIYATKFSDEVVPKGEDRHIRLSVKEGLVESLPVSLVLGYCFWWPAAVIFSSVVCLHHFMWNQIHLEMHKPRGRFFADWKIFRFVHTHHLVHHRYPATNFNVVLPIADFLFGTLATQKQHVEALAVMSQKEDGVIPITRR